MAEETIVAVYNSAADADAAVAELRAAKVPESAISRHAASSTTATTGMSGTGMSGTGMSGTSATGEQPGFWSRLFGSEESYGHDSAVYDRSLTEGSAVVTVSSIPDHDLDAVARILERHNPIDIDERAVGYGMQSTAATAGVGYAGTTGTGYAAPATGTAARTAGTDAGSIQLSQESLAVGKRVVNRGGARIRRYVVETPVEENVTLHTEKVTLDRRPVTDGRPVTDADFTEKTIEMTSSAEEAVVSKTARVVEEVSLHKEVSDRVETVRDTLRKDAVEIEQLPGDASVTSTSTTTGTTGTTTPRMPRT